MIRKHASWAARLGAAGALLLSGGCNVDDLLEVNNPAQIPVAALDDPKLLKVRLNGVVSNFNVAYVSSGIQYANYITDEIITGLNWEDYARANQRIVSYLEGPTLGMFQNPSRALRMADGLAEDIRGWAADDPDEDFDSELAKALAYAGYAALVLAENTCQQVISPDPDDPSGDLLESLETFEIAIDYLEEAVAVAQRAGDSGVRNLAYTGLARANLNAQQWAAAAAAAANVTPGFKFWIDYVDLPDGRNPLQGASFGGNFTHGINPLFLGTHPSFAGTGFSFRAQNVIAPQTDPRIQHLPSRATGHNGLTPLYKLIQGLRYSEYNGKTIAPASAACPGCTGTSASSMPLLATFSTDILLADYTEARHHYHEALSMQGGNEAEINAFVNERRAVGNQPPVTLTGQALRNELRNQRARDLFMGGFRVADLRRWTRVDPGKGPFAGGSYFPTGPHPNSPVWSDYESWTCYPIPLAEYEGNPNLAKPLNPNVPPGI